MGATTKYALRFPNGVDPANIPLDMQELAEDVDGQMAGQTSSTRAGLPAAGKNGRLHRITDDGQILFDTGSAFRDPISPLALQRRLLASCRTRIPQGTPTGAHYAQDGSFVVADNTSSGNGMPAIFQVNPASWVIPGFDFKARLEVDAICNDFGELANSIKPQVRRVGYGGNVASSIKVFSTSIVDDTVGAMFFTGGATPQFESRQGNAFTVPSSASPLCFYLENIGAATPVSSLAVFYMKLWGIWTPQAPLT